MGSLVMAVMMLSGGLAVVARCLEGAGGPIWGVPSLAFFLGLGVACGGMFAFVRGVTKRSRRAFDLHPDEAGPRFAPWTATPSEDAFDPYRDRAFDRGDLPGFPLSREQIKEAARLLMFAGREEVEKIARARHAGRSACRRGHARGPTPPRTKRRRVRPRPRLFM